MFESVTVSLKLDTRILNSFKKITNHNLLKKKMLFEFPGHDLKLEEDFDVKYIFDELISEIEMSVIMFKSLGKVKMNVNPRK